MSSSQLTPRQAAGLVGVSESTVRRWCDGKLLDFGKTTGGHRRIDRVTLLEFARERGLRVINSAPATTAGRGGRLSSPAELSDRLFEHLVSGDETAVKQFVVGLIERSGDGASLCDQIIAPAMHRIGSEWSSKQLPIYREHIATQLIQMAIWSARSSVERPGDEAPSAICAGLSDDPYTLGSVMSALVLQQQGFRAAVLGSETPVEEIIDAARERGAAIVAISVGTISSVEARVDEFRQLGEAARRFHFRVLAGGNQMTAELRRQIDPDFFGDTMGHLANYSRRVVEEVASTR